MCEREAPFYKENSRSENAASRKANKELRNLRKDHVFADYLISSKVKQHQESSANIRCDNQTTGRQNLMMDSPSNLPDCDEQKKKSSFHGERGEGEWEGTSGRQ